jgi:hypothetical protein
MLADIVREEKRNHRMNLSARHVPVVLVGALVGSGLGWSVCCLLNCGSISSLEDTLGQHGAGLVFGAIAGMALAVIVLVVKASRDPKIGPASNFSQINGMGSALIGRRDQREDGSYVTTEWFTILWLPVFPVCQYRLIKHKDASNLVHQEYSILEKFPPKGSEVIKVYAVTLLIVLAIVGILLVVDR